MNQWSWIANSRIPFDVGCRNCFLRWDVLTFPHPPFSCLNVENAARTSMLAAQPFPLNGIPLHPLIMRAFLVIFPDYFDPTKFCNSRIRVYSRDVKWTVDDRVRRMPSDLGLRIRHGPPFTRFPLTTQHYSVHLSAPLARSCSPYASLPPRPPLVILLPTSTHLRIPRTHARVFLFLRWRFVRQKITLTSERGIRSGYSRRDEDRDGFWSERLANVGWK